MLFFGEKSIGMALLFWYYTYRKAKENLLRSKQK